MRKYIILVSVLFSFLNSFSQSAPIGPVGPACDKTLVGVDTMLTEVKLKYKTAVNYNREALNVYGYQATDIPTYNDSVITYRMKLIESPISMDYNSYVKAYIGLYSQRRRESVSKMLGVSDYYFPLFEEILDKYNLPHEFKYLSVVESALNPNAQSWCGATGLWQFMHATGLDYGLVINSKVDERRDPVRATEAMCQYITNSYNQFGDWLLAIASYNCGPGWVAYAVRKGGSNNFWDIQHFLPAETRGYVPAFLAACYVFKYAPEHNLFPAEPEINYPVERVELEQSVSYYQLSQVLGVTINELEKLNPSFKKGYVSVGYKSEFITLPQHAAIKFWGNKQKVYSSPEVDYSMTAMADISQTKAVITTTEGMLEENKILAEQNKTETVKEAASDIPVKGNYKKLIYKVQTGDDLNYVCNRFNCDKWVIMQWNNLMSDTLLEGVEIKLYVPNVL